MADNRIIVEVQNVVVGAQQGAAQGATAQGTTPGAQIPSAPVNARQSASNAFLGGISAQMVVGSVARIVAASGNQEVSRAISETAGYGFLAARLVGSQGLDIGAWIALLTKSTADIIQLVQSNREEKREMASQQNALDIVRIRSGQISINANTEISYNRYGRVTFTNRK